MKLKIEEVKKEEENETFWSLFLSFFFLFSFVLNAITYVTDGYSTEDVIFQWAPEDPVQIAEDTELPQFNLMDTKTSICTKVYSTGKQILFFPTWIRDVFFFFLSTQKCSQINVSFCQDF